MKARMNRLSIFLLVAFIIAIATCFVANHQAAELLDLNEESLELIHKQNAAIEDLTRVIERQNAIIDAFEDQLGGRITTESKPKEPVTY